MATPTLVRKIVARIVMESDLDKPSKPTDLFSVIGIVNGLKEGKSDYGPYTKLIGQFEATRARDKAVFLAPVAFLPEPFHGMVSAAVRQQIQDTTTYEKNDKGEPIMDKNGEPVIKRDGHAAVQFAVMVGYRPTTKKGGTGYEFTVTPIVQPNQADALGALRDATAKALPAPAQK